MNAKYLVASAILAGGMPGLVAQNFELAGPGGAASIVVPTNAEDSTTWAAEALRDYVRRITGREMPICAARGGAARAVVIGTLATLGDVVPADIAAKLRAADRYEASFTRATADTLWLVG